MRTHETRQSEGQYWTTTRAMPCASDYGNEGFPAHHSVRVPAVQAKGKSMTFVIGFLTGWATLGLFLALAAKAEDREQRLAEVEADPHDVDASPHWRRK